MKNKDAAYVQVDEVAHHFSVSTATIRQWVRQGIIPKSAYINVGQVYRFRIPEIEAALMASSKNSEEPEQLEFDFNQDQN